MLSLHQLLCVSTLRAGVYEGDVKSDGCFTAQSQRDEEWGGGGRISGGGLLFQRGGSRDPNEPWPRLFTHSVIYAHPAHTIYPARLIALPLFPLLSSPLLQLPAHAQSCTQAAFPDVLSPSSWWAELSQSIRRQSLSKGGRSWETNRPKKMTQGIKGVISIREQSEAFNKNHFL